MALCLIFAVFSRCRHDAPQVRRRSGSIRLHDAWARFCREVIVISAYGKTETLSGTPLGTCNPSIKNRGDVVPFLMTLYPHRRQEPSWFSAVDCSDAGNRLGIHNAATVTAALGAANSPANRLRETRNFYAHRKKQTAIKAIAAGNFIGPHSPQIFHLNSYVAGGRTLLESWTDDLIVVATAAVQ